MSASQYNAYYERGGWNRDSQYPFRYFKSLSKISALPTDPTTTKSALDLGCGLGEFTEGLVAIGYGDVVGIDMSSKSIEMCEKSRLKSKRTHYVHTDFFQHDFGDRKFDFILAIGFSPFSSSNFQQVDRTLQRLRSLVHPSSSITVTVPSNGQSGGKSWYSWNVNENLSGSWRSDIIKLSKFISSLASHVRVGLCLGLAGSAITLYGSFVGSLAGVLYSVLSYNPLEQNELSEGGSI